MKHEDKIAHFLAGAGTFIIVSIIGGGWLALYGQATARNVAALGMLAAILVGLGKEIHDRYIMRRVFSALDLSATVLGGLFFAVILLLVGCNRPQPIAAPQPLDTSGALAPVTRAQVRIESARADVSTAKVDASAASGARLESADRNLAGAATDLKTVDGELAKLRAVTAATETTLRTTIAEQEAALGKARAVEAEYNAAWLGRRAWRAIYWIASLITLWGILQAVLWFSAPNLSLNPFVWIGGLIKSLLAKGKS